MTRKTLNTIEIANELEGASLHFRRPQAGNSMSTEAVKRAARHQKPAPPRAAATQAVFPPKASSSAASPPSNNEHEQLTSRVVERPVSFYIPEIINGKIDEAVDYFAKGHGVRVDRSAVVSAILGDPVLWKSQSLDRLVSRAVDQLTSRLTNRLTSRPTERSGEGQNGQREAPTQQKNPLTEVEMRSAP